MNKNEMGNYGKRHNSNPSCTKKLVPNPYGIDIVIDFDPSKSITSRIRDNSTAGYLLDLLVVKRGYLKTILNFINDSIDSYVFSYALDKFYFVRNKHSFREEFEVHCNRYDLSGEYFANLEESSLNDYLVEIKKALNGKHLDLPDTLQNLSNVGFYSKDGFYCCYNDKSINTILDTDYTYICLERRIILQLKMIISFIDKMFAKSGNLNAEKTQHQKAAILYLDTILIDNLTITHMD